MVFLEKSSGQIDNGSGPIYCWFYFLCDFINGYIHLICWCIHRIKKGKVIGLNHCIGKEWMGRINDRWLLRHRINIVVATETVSKKTPKIPPNKTLFRFLPPYSSLILLSPLPSTISPPLRFCFCKTLKRPNGWHKFIKSFRSFVNLSTSTSTSTSFSSYLFFSSASFLFILFASSQFSSSSSFSFCFLSNEPWVNSWGIKDIDSCCETSPPDTAPVRKFKILILSMNPTIYCVADSVPEFYLSTVVPI